MGKPFNLIAIDYSNSEFRGVMVPPIDQLTTDGYDLQFGTNCLGRLLSISRLIYSKTDTLISVTGHFYFIKLLLPILLDTAKST